jgi:hypothetical protein
VEIRLSAAIPHGGLANRPGRKLSKVRIFTQFGEKLLSGALFRPSTETPEYAVPFAELFRQEQRKSAIAAALKMIQEWKKAAHPPAAPPVKR